MLRGTLSNWDILNVVLKIMDRWSTVLKETRENNQKISLSSKSLFAANILSLNFFESNKLLSFVVPMNSLLCCFLWVLGIFITLTFSNSIFASRFWWLPNGLLTCSASSSWFVSVLYHSYNLYLIDDGFINLCVLHCWFREKTDQNVWGYFHTFWLQHLTSAGWSPTFCFNILANKFKNKLVGWLSRNIQWGKKVITQPSVVQILPLKNMS